MLRKRNYWNPNMLLGHMIYKLPFLTLSSCGKASKTNLIKQKTIQTLWGQKETM
jgi:hypothetical protein